MVVDSLDGEGSHPFEAIVHLHVDVGCCYLLLAELLADNGLVFFANVLQGVFYIGQ
jgi:hypothetical protein